MSSKNYLEIRKTQKLGKNKIRIKKNKSHFVKLFSNH